MFLAFAVPLILALCYFHPDGHIIRDIFCIHISSSMSPSSATFLTTKFCPPLPQLAKQREKHQHHQSGENHHQHEPGKPCIFCDIVHHNKQARVVYQDDSFTAFHDINPSAKVHFLIIPNHHVGTVKELNASHLPMLDKMESLGNKLLKELNVSESKRVFGFHVPPFNSVEHLHLHVIGTPFNNLFRYLKYPSVNMPWWLKLSSLKERLKSD